MTHLMRSRFKVEEQNKKSKRKDRKIRSQCVIEG